MGNWPQMGLHMSFFDPMFFTAKAQDQQDHNLIYQTSLKKNKNKNSHKRKNTKTNGLAESQLVPTKHHIRKFTPRKKRKKRRKKERKHTSATAFGEDSFSSKILTFLLFHNTQHTTWGMLSHSLSKMQQIPFKCLLAAFPKPGH